MYESKCVPFVCAGYKVSLRQQYVLLGLASIPLLYFVGAPQVIFWILGMIMPAPARCTALFRGLLSFGSMS